MSDGVGVGGDDVMVMVMDTVMLVLVFGLGVSVGQFECLPRAAAQRKHMVRSILP